MAAWFFSIFASHKIDGKQPALPYFTAQPTVRNKQSQFTYLFEFALHGTEDTAETKYYVSGKWSDETGEDGATREGKSDTWR